MALSAHIDELESRHRALDDQIRRTLSSPGAKDEKIVELKKKKLELKDKILSLRIKLDD